MGAWDYGVFDDDSAYDVIEELQIAENVTDYLEKAFTAVISDSAYIEYDEGIAVSVCGAVLDSILSKTAYRFDGFSSEEGDGSQQYLNWIASLKDIDCDALRPKAVQALKRLISEDSELNELWSETDLYSKWKNLYLQMIERLL